MGFFLFVCFSGSFLLFFYFYFMGCFPFSDWGFSPFILTCMGRSSLKTTSQCLGMQHLQDSQTLRASMSGVWPRARGPFDSFTLERLLSYGNLDDAASANIWLSFTFELQKIRCPASLIKLEGCIRAKKKILRWCFFNFYCVSFLKIFQIP